MAQFPRMLVFGGRHIFLQLLLGSGRHSCLATVSRHDQLLHLDLYCSNLRLSLVIVIKSGHNVLAFAN